MPGTPDRDRLVVPPLDAWLAVVRPDDLAERLHDAAAAAVRIAAAAGYQIRRPAAAGLRFEIAQSPSEDWALPRRVQDAVGFLELVNELVPVLAGRADGALLVRMFTAGELSARLAAAESEGPEAAGPRAEAAAKQAEQLRRQAEERNRRTVLAAVNEARRLHPDWDGDRLVKLAHELLTPQGESPGESRIRKLADDPEPPAGP